MNYPESAYLHIPFCTSKCFYCAFTSTCNLNLKTGYLISLLKDIDTNYKNNYLKTIYFGGGTPSLLSLSEVEKLLKKFNFDDKTEITFELNPEQANKDYLEGLYSFGINRLSIGIQTFDDEILKTIGRKHDPKTAINAVKLAQKAGFDNISLDFIYGLPNQKIEDFESDLKQGLALGVTHVSLYGLKIEEGTVFSVKTPNNLPNDDEQADMYLAACEILKDFYHYEISNFSKDESYISKHNTTYWKNNEYYGFGCGAHGYEKKFRYANQFDIKSYMESPLVKDFGHALPETEIEEEEIFLGLRLSAGIDVNNINKKFNIDFEKKYSKIIDKYCKCGYLQKTQKGYSLTNQGFLVSNIILAEFMQNE